MMRLSNALGDLLLGASHVVLCWKAIGRGEGPLRILVPAYFGVLATFQLLGAVFHVWDPAHSRADAIWLAYLATGAVSPCLYGAALSLAVLAKPRRAVVGWFLGAASYLLLAGLRLDLALVLGLPKRLTITLPARAALALKDIWWMPSALRKNGQRTPGQAPLTLTFDGRGYAATPKDRVFDDAYEDTFDLVAAFPCWRTDSLPFLFLFVGCIFNSCQVVTCLTAKSPAAKAHICMAVAIMTMPLAMFFGGVPLGIDWMHACAAPCLFAQAKLCLDAQGGRRRHSKEEVPPKKAL